MDDNSIKGNLLKKRMELGYTQTEMAGKLEMSLTAYRKLEGGKTRILNEHVGKFADSTGTSIAELVNGFKPVNSEKSGLEDIKENYNLKIRDLQEEYGQETEKLRAEIMVLRDKLKDKEDIIATDKKLIRQYEKELKDREG